MKPEKQQIAILEAMGWTETEPWLNGRRCFERADNNSGWGLDDLPDYLNDLNAINSAVLSRLNGPAPDGWNFIDNLRIACRIPHSSTCMALVCATAAQRAEAFLRTIGKWEDEK